MSNSGGMTGARSSRSTRITVAPWSASIIPANGAGPIPASSTMRIPESAPAIGPQ
jgi:hypothetical protein